MSQEHTCEICERLFEGYIVPIKDDFTAITEWERRKQRFEHLCKWCNHMYFQQDWEGKREFARYYSEEKTWEDPREEVSKS